MKKLLISHDYHKVILPHEGLRYAIFIATNISGHIVATAEVSPFGVGDDIHPFVSGLHVDLSHRRKGIARGLMDYIAEQCHRNQNETLALYVKENNLEARELYLSLGFHTYLVDDDQLLMAVRIDQMTEVAS